MRIGITGGKGGTGKSTIATALAYSMAREKNVLLVDADVDCPNDHLLLGISRKFLKPVEQRIPVWDLDKCDRCGLCGPACRMNAIVSIKGRDPIFMPAQCNGCGACRIACPKGAISWGKKEIGKIFTGEGHGIRLVSGELKPNEPVSELVVNELNAVISKEKDADHIIVDTAAGAHCPVIAALEACDRIIAVTEPTPLGAHDLRIILETIKEIGKEAWIVINRSDIGEKSIILDLAKKYGSKVIAEVPYSEEIVRQYSASSPIIYSGLDPVIGSILGGEENEG